MHNVLLGLKCQCVCSAEVRALRDEHSAHVHAAERRPEQQAVHAVHDDHLLGRGDQPVQRGAPARHSTRKPTSLHSTPRHSPIRKRIPN